jgi:hypothetical protein
VHRQDVMALREFTDSTGRGWRVWDIRPEQMHAATRAEDHLQSVINGWLAFEPAAGGEKRRLAPIPARWDTATEVELEAMLERAEPARNEVAATPRRESPAPTGVAQPSIQSAPGARIRTFLYPSGRYWTVNELSADSTGAATRHPLLRFTSGSRALDTADWPSEWVDMSEGDLSELLYRSFPRDRSAANPTEFRRRRGDSA